MKKIIILLLRCGVLVSMVGCGGNTSSPPTESPPTTVSETIITEIPIETTPPTTAVEPTEEKESIPTESKDLATEPTVTTTDPTTETAKGKNQANGNPKTDRAIGGGNFKGKRMYHHSGNGQSAERENYNPTEAEC